MIPCKKVRVRAIFCRSVIFNPHTSGRGSKSMTVPVTTFEMEM